MSQSHIKVITIDGPSASGKGTIARLLANTLKWHYLESGAVYRILALKAISANIQVNDVARLVTEALNLQIRFESDYSDRVFLSEVDVTKEIHTEECGNWASKIAALPEVREALLERQRAFRTPPGLVTDGRDMGTIVFPDASIKFFLIADRMERAKRRYLQLKKRGANVTLEGILDELAERDFRDENRAVAPLKPASDAISMDTSLLDVDQTLERVMGYVRQYLGASVDV